ncbi:hypothetical protein LguiA_029522 [Lonicera macranthoides]
MCGRREGQLVKIVVEKVLSKLKKNYTHLPEILVGMDHHVDKLKELLNIESNGIRFVGIHGMGGLGKTTIAKVIYNQLCESFERHCFLEDIRENSNGNRIVNLQNQLVSKILKRQIPTFDDDNEGLNKIRGSIRGKKVFIVLDDVDKISQIEKLAGNFNCYGAGSRIIFTTRDAEVLAAFQVSCEREGSSDVYASYEPNLMDDDHSLKLFSKYAFMRDSPPKDYEILADDLLTRKVKVLCLDLRQDSEIDPNIQSQCLVGVDLRFLRLGCANLEGDFKHFLPSLRWLQWSCKINFTPANFLLKNLVILDLSGSQITDEWKGWSQSKVP